MPKKEVKKELPKQGIVYPKVTVGDVLRLYMVSIKKHWISFSITFITVILASLTVIVTPLYYKNFFDALASSQDRIQTGPHLIAILVTIFLLNGLNWLAWRINGFANAHFQPYTMSDLRNSAFEYLIDHSYSFFSNNFTGSLSQRVNRYARSFENLVDRLLFDVFPLFIQVVGVLIVLYFINQTVTFILIAWFVILIITNYILAKWKLKYDIEAAALDSKITATLSDAITNHNSVQLFNGRKVESKTFRGVNMEWSKLTKFRWSVDNVVGAIQAGFFFIAEFLLFYYSIGYWQKGLVTIGFFVLIQSYILSLADRLWNIGRTIRNIYEAFADAKEMVEIIKLEHEIKDIPKASTLNVSKGEIDFINVVFAFNVTRPVLKGINLHVNSGEKIALIGPSGAGKSTFVRLLLRLYDIQGGEILVDGKNIARVTQTSLRENISLVPQDPVLFHRTLMENIRYGKRDATDKEVIEAAKLAHCDDFIEALPHKYDTYVGERGIKLSGGERQRVAIARAILKNAPILILDEATSSLDSHSESLIQDALDVLMKGKTTIVIAHRLSTIRKMDRIVVVEDGNILEQGSHEELLQTEKSLYKKLWNLQAGGFLVEDDEE
jgi:ATP-binding cassette subfamily B protein